MIDKIDMKILEMLKKDSRTSLNIISQEVGISKTAVKKRIDKLRKSGIIIGFSININDSFEVCKRQGVIGLNIYKSKFFEVIEGLKKLKYIESVYTCTGAHDIYVFVNAPHGILDKINKQVKEIKGVKSVCFNVLQDRKR